MLTRKVDVKLAPGLRVGYIMGTGDEVPDAIEALGVMPHLLTKAEIASGDLSAWNVLVVGIRAYSALPELAAAQPRLNDFVRRGGTLIVLYQSGNFPAPFPLSMGRNADLRVGGLRIHCSLRPTLSLPLISTAGLKSAATPFSIPGIRRTPP